MEMSRRTEMDVNETIKRICKNKKNINSIQEYLEYLIQNDLNKTLQSISILVGVFSFYLKKGRLNVNNNDRNPNNSTDDVVDEWISMNYKAFIEILHSFVQTKDIPIQKACVDALMSLLQLQNTASQQIIHYPNQMFIQIIESLIFSNYSTNHELVMHFQKFLEYQDNRYYCLKNCHSLLQQHKDTFVPISQKVNGSSKQQQYRNEAIITTHLILVAALKFDSLDVYDEEEKLFVVKRNSGDEEERYCFKKFYKTAFNSAWLSILRIPNLSRIVHKKILLDLEDKIFPKLSDPKLLIDFLTDSYDSGGVLSLLALNSLFILINNYNLDYPDFYPKLYNLLEPNIFSTKYKERFIHLLDLFLSSSHLSTYLVAAFIKRLARIALFSPGPDVPMLLVLIRNLFIRHPSCKVLVHRKIETERVLEKTDPYDYAASDPSESNALKSCLWELASLKSHYSSQVLKTVGIFKKDFPLVGDDVTDWCNSYENLFEEKLKETSVISPVNFERNADLFKDIDKNMWTY